MSVQNLRTKLSTIDQCFVTDRISELDILENGDALNRKIEAAQSTEVMLERMRTCRTAGEVFGEFSRDMAMAKVDEAYYGKTSDARQRAQETVLEYALGKPINRIMSLTMGISDAKDCELESDIKRLLVELGYEGREGTIAALLAEPQGDKRQDETEPV